MGETRSEIDGENGGQRRVCAVPHVAHEVRVNRDLVQRGRCTSYDDMRHESIRSAGGAHLQVYGGRAGCRLVAVVECGDGFGNEPRSRSFLLDERYDILQTIDETDIDLCEPPFATDEKRIRLN